MDEDLKRNVTATNTWMRVLYMVLFLIIYGIAEMVWFATVVFQLIHALITGAPRANVQDFSETVCTFMYEVLLYISYNSEERPYPFAPWPDAEFAAETREIPAHVEANYEPGDETEEPQAEDQEQPAEKEK